MKTKKSTIETFTLNVLDRKKLSAISGGAVYIGGGKTTQTGSGEGGGKDDPIETGTMTSRG